jgi:hypothetical protein
MGQGQEQEEGRVPYFGWSPEPRWERGRERGQEAEEGMPEGSAHVPVVRRRQDPRSADHWLAKRAYWQLRWMVLGCWAWPRQQWAGPRK